MGRRGPRQKPNDILSLEGSRKAARDTSKESREVLKLENVEPEEWMDDIAKAKWREIMPALLDLDIYREPDRPALVRYCCCWSRWVKAQKFLQEKGETYAITDDNGKVKCMAQWPQVSIAVKMAAACLRLEQEFGLTPIARQSMKLGGPKKQSNPLDDFVKARG